MIVDTERGNHKMIWYQQPEGIESIANLQVQKGKIVKLDANTQLSFFVSIWQHRSLLCANKKPLTIWVGTKTDVERQLKEIYQKSGLDEEHSDFFKFVPNVDLIAAQQEQKKTSPKPSLSKVAKLAPRKAQAPVALSQAGFSVHDVQLGQEYEGYVKLIYNYGMFITVKGVEGLLHKKQIVTPDGVDWKKYYNIGDKIKVKAFQFKEID